MSLTRKKTLEIYTELNSNLELCDDLDFIDSLGAGISVKNLLPAFGMFAAKPENVSWQLLAVATKLQRI